MKWPDAVAISVTAIAVAWVLTSCINSLVTTP